jgi:hypothetical protein
MLARPALLLEAPLEGALGMVRERVVGGGVVSGREEWRRQRQP